MQKVTRSHYRKEERDYERIGGAAQGGTYQRVHYENGGAPYATSPPSSVRNGSAQGGTYQRVHYENGGSPYGTSQPFSVRNGTAHHQQRQQQQEQYDFYKRSAASDYSGRNGGYADSTYQRGGTGKGLSRNNGYNHYHDQSFAVYGQQGQRFSESSSYETKEHYERKVIRKKPKARKANGHVSNGNLSGERRDFKEMPIQKAVQYANGFPGEGLEEFDTLGNEPVKPTIVEHEDEMQTFEEDTVTKTQFYEMEGLLHKQTGEILNFVEAVRQGLLDLSSGGGEFFDLVSGSKISLEKAVEMKLVGEDVNQILRAKHGIMHPETGEQLTLLEAIQIGLYDPEIRQLRDIHTGEIISLFDARKIVPMDVQRRLIKMGVLKLPPITLEQAIQQNVVNTQTGHFTGKFSGDMPLQDALYNGYIQLRSQQVPTIAISLSDCLRDGFIDGHSGEFNDRSSNDKFTLRDALSRDNKLLNEHIREIVNTDTNQRITLADAILSHAIDPKQGTFTDLRNRNSIPLSQAYNNDFISKPLTLTEVIERDLLDSAQRFIDRGTKNRFTLLEAIASGIVDPEVRHIVDPDEEDVVSIAEALERGLLEPDGRISLLKQQRTLSLHEAHRDGLLTKRVRHTIFDVKGIKNTETGENLSFNEAVEAGAIVVQ
uniref:Uncharacterized protein n=1 Tax=Acrobeloides nanus TaxID=290746 RepID=A0A914CKV1_9BILA